MVWHSGLIVRDVEFFCSLPAAQDLLAERDGPEEKAGELPGLLDEIAREGARRMLVQALEAEVAAYLAAHAEALDEEGHRLVVRNGKARAR
jgi:hypothetical protein